MFPARAHAAIPCRLSGFLASGAKIVKTIILSNHVSDLREEARAEREAADRTKLRHHDHRIAELRARAKASWLWRIYRAIFGYPAPPAPSGASDAEQALTAGAGGEDRVAAHLANILPADWVLLRGYTNRNGEADLVLIADRAVFCIEVKNVNGVISISSGTWLRRKVDAYGNVVGHPEPIVDRRGRTPLQQAERVADGIHWILERRGIDASCVLPMVILPHQRAKIADNRERFPAFLLTETDRTLFLDMQADLLPFDRENVLRILTRDHAHWADRHQRPGHSHRNKPA